MNVRAIDMPIPAEEVLYRRISVDDVGGGRILPSSIDIPGCSVNRGKYGAPESVFVAAEPAYNGIAAVSAGDIPPDLERPGAAAIRFEAQDAPREDNNAHAEIRAIRVDRGWEPSLRVKSRAVRDRIKGEIASRFRVHTEPQ